MDSLSKEDNIRELKESLQRLPKDLDKTYDDALERIKQQDSRKLARADQVLTLISCAKQPLKLEEMRQALSIRKGDTFIDPEALPKTESLISTCCGLVVVEDESQIVRLVHYTTEEYFKRKLHRYCGLAAHGYFAGILITYLNFATFSTFSLDKVIEDAMNEAAARDADVSMNWMEERRVIRNYMENLFESNILVQYAAENWVYHTRDALTNIGDNPDACLATTDPRNGETDNPWNLKQLIPDFLEKEHNVACANEVSHYADTKLHKPTLGHEFRGPTNVTNLHMAASIGIQYFVEYYLNQGAKINATDSMGMTALHRAAYYGHLEVVRLLLNSGAEIGIRDQRGNSALDRAVGTNQVSVSRLLLQNGSDPGFKSYSYSTMSTAATRGHEQTLELLAEHGTEDGKKKQVMRDILLEAAFDGRDGIVRLLVRGGKKWSMSKQNLAMAMTKAASQGQVKIMKTLLEAGVDVSSPLSLGGESLREAATRGSSEATQLLLTAGANPNLRIDGGDLPLHVAARNGHVRTVALLLEKGADVNALNSKGETAMVVIAGPKYGFMARSTTLPEHSVSVMQRLLEKGANTHATEPRSNRTSLECAVIRGHEGLVQLLLQYESFAPTQKVLMLYLTKLYHAIRGMSNNDEAVDRLLREKEAQGLGRISNLLLIPIPAERGYERVVLTFLQSGAAIEAEDDLQGNTALQVSAWNGHIAVVEILLQQAAEIDSRGSTDAAPLMMAASKGETDVVRLLLEWGAELGAASANSVSGSTAVAQALYGQHTATARVLLERGADANARFNQSFEGTLLHAAARYSDWTCPTPNIDLLLEKGADLEAKDSHGQTPLVVGVEYQKVPTVQHLLERGADVETKDSRGQTPLMVAVQIPRLETVSLLLERGADLEAKDSRGRTALAVAAQKGTPAKMNLLLKKGANLEARNNSGHTPLVVAVQSGEVENVEFLLERGADPESLPSSVTIEHDEINKWDFDRAVRLVLDAQLATERLSGGWGGCQI